MKSIQRRNFLSKPGFQFKFIAFSISISIIVTAIFYVSCTYFFWKFTSLGQAFEIPKNSPFLIFITQQQIFMNKIFIKASILLNSLIVISGVLYSHRIAGPIKRLEIEMNKIHKIEDFKRIQIRKHDYFFELVETFNNMCQRITSESSSDKKR